MSFISPVRLSQHQAFCIFWTLGYRKKHNTPTHTHTHRQTLNSNLIRNAGRCGHDRRADPHGKGVGLHLVKGALMEPWRIMALWSHVLFVQISFALTVHVAVGRSVWMSRFMLSVSVSAFSLTISTNFYQPFGSLLFLFFFHLTFHHVVLGLLRAASTGLYFAPILFLKPWESLA